jgi:hypothetical protein
VPEAPSPGQLRGLHALGLVSGTPWVRATPPTPDSVVEAITRLLDAADPLARLAAALNSSNPP